MLENSHAMANSLLFFLWILLFVLNSGVVYGNYVVEKNIISIIVPQDLISFHDGAISNYGVPDYPGSIIASVNYPSKNTDACKPFEDDKPFKSNPSLPTILIVDRGGCYLTKKVWHAQQAGAAAVLIADDIDEPLITIDFQKDQYVNKINIPSALIKKSFGEVLKKAMENKKEVVIKLEWHGPIMPNQGTRVEYELWTNKLHECGANCDDQMNLIKNFKGYAQILEKGGYTEFTPHYITWYCQQSSRFSRQCQSQCINHGRYCAFDPESGFLVRFEGKDVVLENLRQICVHKVAKTENRSWIWWDYVTDFYIRCSVKENKYSKTCAEEVLKSLNLPVDDIKKCMGDPDADIENEVLKNEQEMQVGHGGRGDVNILPTLIINDIQYRGKLERSAVLKAICVEFEGTTNPPICSNSDFEEFKESSECSCESTSGGYDCKCGENHFYIEKNDTTIVKTAPKFPWFLPLLLLAIVSFAARASYLFNKYTLQSEFDSENMAITLQRLAVLDPKIGSS